MKKRFLRLTALWLAVTLSAAVLTSCITMRYTITPRTFTHTSPIVPNPMKGFVSTFHENDPDKANPSYSMEYIGLKFSHIYHIENGAASFDREEIDQFLNKVNSRGNTAILRVYILNPGKNAEGTHGLFLPTELYDTLKADGRIYSDPLDDDFVEYPDFNDERLIDAMIDFVGKFAEAYDGHPGIAAVQMGLYGSWGEWNMSNCSNTSCVMTNQNLNRLIEAFTQSFTRTKLMARNPSLGNANRYDIGFHDDNFLFNSSDYHTQSKAWKNLLEQVDPSYGTLQQFYDFIDGQNGNYMPLWDRWETQMFGGELSGFMYNPPFGPLWSGTEREALDYCIRQFHMSWLMGCGQGGIPKKDTPEYAQYEAVSASFGYDLAIAKVEAKERTGKILTAFTNYGVAPFYYDWVPEYQLIDSLGNVTYTCQDTDFRLSEVLPNAEVESVFFIPDETIPGDYILRVRFINPAETLSEKAKPLLLSNDNALENGVYELASITAK